MKDKDAVVKARTSYNVLFEDQKVLVINITKLKSAETTIINLKKAVEDNAAKDKAKAQEVKDKTAAQEASDKSSPKIVENKGTSTITAQAVTPTPTLTNNADAVAVN